MIDKKFYITLEVTAQCDGSLVKDIKENRHKYYSKLMDFINSRNRTLDYSFYIHSDHVLSIYDEKGNEIC